MKNKILFTLIIYIIVIGFGYIERGYADWLGAAAMLALVIPMVATWHRIEKEGGKK